MTGVSGARFGRLVPWPTISVADVVGKGTGTTRPFREAGNRPWIFRSSAAVCRGGSPLRRLGNASVEQHAKAFELALRQPLVADEMHDERFS